MTNFKDKNLIITILLIVCLVLGGSLVYSQVNRGPETETEKGAIVKEKAANLVLDYINKNISGGNLTATLVGDVEEEKGLYKFQVQVGEEKFLSYVTTDGKLFLPQGISLEEKEGDKERSQNTEEKAQEKTVTVGNFSVSEEEVCKEEEKPIVYFFGSESCSHCQWEHPIVKEVAGKFAEFISFHDNTDVNEDMDVFRKYSTGGIPTLVLGCKYYRVGSGERAGETEESKALQALICKLTQNQPAGVCSEVQDLIQKIQ